VEVVVPKLKVPKMTRIDTISSLQCSSAHLQNNLEVSKLCT